MIEVEVKAAISNFDSIKKKLNAINAKLSHVEYQEDIYFNSPIRNFAKTDEALRIRKTIIDENVSIFITYKGAKIDKSSKTREEIELKVQDAEKIAEIFNKLGFKKAAVVCKTRTIYTLKEYIISLDDVQGLKPYMEIEIDLEDDTSFQNALKNIYEIFHKLGIDEGFERTSYLELLENKKKN